MCELDGYDYRSGEIAAPQSTMNRRRFGALAAGFAGAVLLGSKVSATTETTTTGGACLTVEGPDLANVPRVLAPESNPNVSMDHVEVAPGLSIIRREAWAQGLEPVGPLQPEDVKFLLVHHSDTSNDHDIAKVPKILQGVFAMDTGPSKKWNDVCYNFFVDRIGNVYEARKGSLDGPVMADATAGSQGFAQLVCMLGDFTSVLPSCEQEDATIKLLAWMADRHNLDTTPGVTQSFVSRGANNPRAALGKTVTVRAIEPHNYVSATQCPGNTFAPVVASGQLQAGVHNYRIQQKQPETTTTVAPAPVVVTTIPAAAPVPAPVSTEAPTAAAPGVVPTLPEGDNGNALNTSTHKNSRTTGIIEGTSFIVGGGAGIVYLMDKHERDQQRKAERDEALNDEVTDPDFYPEPQAFPPPSRDENHF